MMILQILEVSEIGIPLSVETQSHIKPSVVRARSDVSTACFTCGAESLNNMTCCYCWKSFCEVHWCQHMAWEKRHEGFAEEYARMWKTKAVPEKARS